MSARGGLSSPMNNPHATPNVHTTAGEADMSTGPKGHVANVTKDIMSGPQQHKRDSTGERDGELSKDQGW